MPPGSECRDAAASCARRRRAEMLGLEGLLKPSWEQFADPGISAGLRPLAGQVTLGT